MLPDIYQWQISDIFDDIILGRGVKRSIHLLEYDDTILTELFIERLLIFKYRPSKIKEAPVQVGQRIPAFYINGKHAVFGYIFYELFSEQQKRKIFGSVARNEKGDWRYHLPVNSPVVVFINPDLREDIDLWHLN